MDRDHCASGAYYIGETWCYMTTDDLTDILYRIARQFCSLVDEKRGRKRVKKQEEKKDK